MIYYNFDGLLKNAGGFCRPFRKFTCVDDWDKNSGSVKCDIPHVLQYTAIFTELSKVLENLLRLIGYLSLTATFLILSVVIW